MSAAPRPRADPEGNPVPGAPIELFRLIVSGDPRPAGRPRFARTRNGGVITRRDPADEPGRRTITVAWMAAGQPKITGTYVALIHAVKPRARGHWLKSGRLSAAGRRAGPPEGDVDNFAKLALDTLVAAKAIDDDRYCLGLTTTKAWAPDPDHPGMLIVEIRSQEPWPAGKIPTIEQHP